MTDFRDLKGDETDVPVSMHGIIAATLTDFAQLAPVILPEYDPDLVWGPCRWQSRNDTDFPAKGDECLVVFSNRREPWISVWWPF